MDLTNANLWIGIIAGILTILGIFSGFFKWVWGKIQGLICPDPNMPRIPHKTIRIILRPGEPASWFMGKRNLGKNTDETEPFMQMVVKFTATNITNYGIMLPLAKMKKPKILGTTSIMIPGHGAPTAFGKIPKGTTAVVTLNLGNPPFKSQGEDFVADVAAVDQFGNEHWVKKVKFQYR